MTSLAPGDNAAALDLLSRGELDVEGRLIGASNATLRAFISVDGVSARCVYKPIQGERPLWDFPEGTLAGREVAAYLVSEATGWHAVPPTVLRDGPFGPGSCQLWIDAVDPPLVDFAPTLPSGWCTVAEAPEGLLGHADDPRLAKIAAYDSIVNNADRKGSHLLRARNSRVYGIDHGVCFHTQDKLRTVLWGWAGTPLPSDVVDTFSRVRKALDRELGAQLVTHITAQEVAAIQTRIDRSLAGRIFPMPGSQWPALPWPAL